MKSLSLNPTKRIGDHLQEAGILTPSQLFVALYDQERTGLPLGEILVLRGWVDAKTVDTLLHRQVRSRLRALLKTMPEKLARFDADPIMGKPPQEIETETYVVQDF
ncbi:hypothetical protein C7271_21275 [filamentous cyanobacterium CCP5]|nr:hypothetical protein C7271_21275 [filamentous cyanobacterium CCP5]